MKFSDIHLRDPFILARLGTYYLYGSRGAETWGKGTGFDVYTSTDLENWSGPTVCFAPPADFWSDTNFWAPEVHEYNGRFYLFASFIGETRKRGTQILTADSPMGPFVLHSDGPLTPAQWGCLDGTLYVEDGVPYMVFCREWRQSADEIIVGEMYAVRLSEDLSRAVGEPIRLFGADEPAWAGFRENFYVTDGPFCYRTREGKPLLLWSSFGKDGYLEAVAYPENGCLTDRWIHPEKPLFCMDGGHGMIFRAFDGRLMFVFHTPNKPPLERSAMLEVVEENGMLRLR